MEKPAWKASCWSGIANEFKAALKTYTEAKGKGDPTHNAAEVLAVLRKEIAFFAAIKMAITKFTTVDKKRSSEEKNSMLKQILDNDIVADDVADIFALAGLDKPNIGLLSDEFLEDVRHMESRNLAVDLEPLRKCHNRSIEMVRRTRQKWKYPPDQQLAAVELMLKQEEVLSNEWLKP